MKKWVTVASVLIIATGCTEEKHGAFVVTGKIENATGKKVMLMEVPFDSPQPLILDSVVLKEDASFTLRGRAEEEGIYRVLIENGPDIILINDNNSIRLNVNINDYQNYKVEGSEASKSLQELFKNYRALDSSLLVSFKQLDTLQKQPGNDSLVNLAKLDRDKQLTAMNNTVKEFITSSQSPAARFYGLGLASRTIAPEELRPLADASAVKFPQHSGLARIKSMLAVKQPTARPSSYALLNKPAPDLNMNDLNGKPIALSQFKGKFVLVDFWASWCGPCRQENPNVVAAFNKYKDKNFTIVGVSLDEDKDAWKQAVEKDKLTWPHMSDLKQWESAAVSTYGFEGIPFNVLIDPTGKIIASGLRGSDLEGKLEEVLR
ncbi:MAG: thioredoxin family protein [Segetibacter sp.]|nr:thioredoxin family protein [Segetibacter sp.]